MTSPFPGMDPYLEQHWGDVHHRFITYACDQLQRVLPGELRARVEERVFVESAAAPGRSIYPDVRIIERGPGPSTSRGAEGGVALAEVDVEVAVEDEAEPLVISLEDEPYFQGFIEIIDARSGNRVITVIEVLSPANKLAGEGQDKYLQKQHELRRAGVSSVEIDLLRTGPRVLAVPPRRLPPSHRTTYQVCVHRGWQPHRFEVYRVPLRALLPTIRIPLREADPDARLDLQALVGQCYANGRYDDIDYKVDPVPPLDPDDAAWADHLLRSKGLR